VRRRVISLGSLLLAAVALAVVLFNATLVDRRPPGIAKVTLSAALNGDPARAQTLTAIDIEFSEPVKTASVERRFRIVPYVQGTLTWNGTEAIFTPSAKLPSDTSFAVYVDPGFEDLAGNAATTGLDAWTFRTVGPPIVVRTDPADGAAGVPVEGALTVTFDRLMDTRTVEGAIEVDPPAPVRAAWSGESVALAFDHQLAFGTSYSVTIGAGAADIDGTHLAAPFTTRFTTAAAGLRVRSTLPADTASGVSVRSPIAVVFDGTIDPASVAGALQITPSVAGDIRVVALPADTTPFPLATPADAGGQVLLFQPSAPLAAHTTYRVTLASVVARPGVPSQIAASRTWSFTTGQPTVSGQNQIAFTSARGGVRDVWLMNPDGSNPRQLTTGLAPVAGYDVTSDGSRLAWSSGGVVQTMGIDGTEARAITAPQTFEYAPRFAPDGRTLLVARRGGDGADLGYWLLPAADGAPSARQLLTSGAPALGSSLLDGDGIDARAETPSWAPRAAFDTAGQHVAIANAEGAVQVVDLAPATPLGAVTNTGIVASGSPVWAASSSEFIVSGRRSGDPADRIYVIGLDGSVTRGPAGSGTPAWSPNGIAAFLSPGAGRTHVAVARLDGGAAPRALTSSADLDDRWPSFSPDGGSVLFGRVRPDSTASAGIWVVDVVTGETRMLSSDGAYPRWLP
jgi:Big-like domain-containing protein/WD40 repeat protein